MDGFTIRAATAEDEDFLLEMLVEAANGPSGSYTRADVLAEPLLAHYVAGFPRPGDLGVLAEHDDGPLGAAWLRAFTSADPGYGYLADDVPELAIGVRADARGRGVGRALLTALDDTARGADVRRISLSVDHDNPARALYESHGYRFVADHGDAATMVLEL